MSTLSLAAADLHNRRVLQPQAPPFSRLFQYAGPSFAFSSSVHNFARRQVREVSICSDRSDGTSERSQRSVSIPSSEVSSVRTDLSEEDAAWVLLCMSRSNTPGRTPSPPMGTRPIPDSLSWEAVASRPSPSESSESQVYCSSASSSRASSPEEVDMVDEAEPKVSTHRPILPKTSVSPKSKPRAVKARSSCSPNLKATPLKADKAEKIEKLSMTDLTDEQKRKVLEYTPRDRAKAARIFRFHNQPEIYEVVDAKCERCASQGWDCFKRIPVMHNTSPGPAAGHGLGCVSCHKSACSFAGKSNKGKGQGKKSKLSIASTDSDCDDE